MLIKQAKMARIILYGFQGRQRSGPFIIVDPEIVSLELNLTCTSCATIMRYTCKNLV